MGKKNLICNDEQASEYDLSDIKDAAENGNETAIYLREALSAPARSIARKKLTDDIWELLYAAVPIIFGLLCVAVGIFLMQENLGDGVVLFSGALLIFLGWPAAAGLRLILRSDTSFKKGE